MSVNTRFTKTSLFRREPTVTFQWEFLVLFLFRAFEIGPSRPACPPARCSQRPWGQLRPRARGPDTRTEASGPGPGPPLAPDLRDFPSLLWKVTHRVPSPQPWGIMFLPAGPYPALASHSLDVPSLQWWLLTKTPQCFLAAVTEPPARTVTHFQPPVSPLGLKAGKKHSVVGFRLPRRVASWGPSSLCPWPGWPGSTFFPVPCASVRMRLELFPAARALSLSGSGCECVEARGCVGATAGVGDGGPLGPGN